MLTNKVFCLGINMSPEMLYLWISLWSKILVDCRMDMDERVPIVVFMEVISIIVPSSELFGLKINCLLEMVKLSWEICSLRNCFGIRHQLR